MIISVTTNEIRQVQTICTVHVLCTFDMTDSLGTTTVINIMIISVLHQSK